MTAAVIARLKPKPDVRRFVRTAKKLRLRVVIKRPSELKDTTPKSITPRQRELIKKINNI